MKQILLLMSAALCASLSAAVVGVGNVRDGMPLVVPQVQELSVTDGGLELPSSLVVSAPAELDLSPLEGIYAQTVPNGVVVRSGESPLVRLELSADVVLGSAEGYALEVKRDGVLVRSQELHGLYNGMQTLCWLLRNRPEPGRLPCCAINDWPDLKMRGLFLQLHSITSAQVERVCHVIDVLGSLKYNTLLIGFDSNFPFTGLPFTGRTAPPLTREDVEKLLAAARRNQIEVIPYMQLVSHTGWMKTHRDWASLREGDNDFGYCLSNPAVQPVVEQLVRDFLDVMQPRYFHIGLDEIEQGRLPSCPQCKAAGEQLEDLMYNHLRPILEMFAQRGVTPIIYQDQFFGFGEPSVQRGLPIRSLPERMGKDTIINSWEYWHFPSDARGKEIRARGFENLLYMSFAISSDNCQFLPKVAARTGALGNILAYWSMMPATMDAPGWPFTDFYPSIVANANYCWNAADVELSRIPIDSAQLLTELLDGSPEYAFRGAASPVPMDGALNRALAADPVFPAFDRASAEEMRRLAALDPAAFDLRLDDGGLPLAIVLSGTQYDGFTAGPVTLPIGTTATGASFLMTAAVYNQFAFPTSVYNLKRHDIGSLRIVYDDGETADIPLTTLRNIDDWNTCQGGNLCRVVLRGNDCNGALFSLYAIDWRNPRPDSTIREIVFSSQPDTLIAPILFAVSLSDAETPPAGAPGPMAIAPPAQRPEAHQETAVGFQDGLPEGTNASAAGARSFEARVVDDASRGKVLELALGPCDDYLARPLVDLPVKAPRDFGAVCFDLKISDPKAVFRPDFYLMDRPIAHELGDTGFFLETDDQWHTICIPRRRFANASGPLTPANAATMSIRFFMHQWPAPTTFQVSDLKYLDGVPPCRLNVTRPVK